MEITDGKLLARESRKSALLEVLLILKDSKDTQEAQEKVKALLEAAK